MTPKPNDLTTGIDIRFGSFSHFLAKKMQKFTGNTLLTFLIYFENDQILILHKKTRENTRKTKANN